jgi:lipopolysaccharide/colanic/teichoic acid biosynthesis glycosyltransferase
MIQRLIALILLFLFSPIFLVIFIVVKLTSSGSFIYKQKRAGKDKKPFNIYKIRTMVKDAEDLKSKIHHLNEADGPVFKINNDPRYTKIGRFLAHKGFDELPQLINIIKGEMAFIGPRPLPIEEAKKISKKYERRFSVLPGMSSLWVIEGADHSDFDRWMKLDLEYVKNKSIWYNLKITLKTIRFLINV